MKIKPSLHRIWFIIVLAMVACTSGVREPGPGASGETMTLTILYTNDEHGWMAPTDDYGGAAGLVRHWDE
ncbi:MAG: hypothetical protein ACP5JG_16720, partial [Anaerolineae bacterium]